MNRYRFIDIKAASEEGTFTGRLSVYGNRDEQGDIVERGAFDRTIQKNGGRVPLLLNHDPAALVGTLELRDSETALEVTGRLVLSTVRARETYDLLRAGALKGLSIGYKTVRDRIESGARRLLEVDLFEGSLTPIPANREALVTSVKTDLASIRDYESFLRHAGGFSRGEAKRLAAGGWKALDAADGDSDESETALLAWLQSQNRRR